MKTLNAKIRSLILGTILSIMATTPAIAASTSGTTNVTVTVSEFIVLHYYSAVSLNFATPDSEALNEGQSSKDVSWNGNSSGGSELAEANLMNAALELEGSKTTVTLSNVWAVRGFSKNGNAKVEVNVPAGKAVMSNEGSEISISNVKVGDNSSTGSSITTKLNGITRNNATFGNIEMELDFSKTSRSGLHTGGQYTITATTI
ncbi:MAG: hypothetical protein K9G39_09000 [Chlorobium sp.]|uniref:hypothetical protein n=1 Tax=Chlorobium sp. TaxID=1095 RepID=UPI0025C642A0|nr:hypothetical protein [Chlorobium sp.]MCF8383710.1 hypothetical protein [Chlorobium sp.]